MSTAITRPNSVPELATIVEEAFKARTPLEILGAGSKRGLGHKVIAARSVSTSALTGITLYEPDEMVLTAKSGTPLVEIENALSGKGQHLGFEPAAWHHLWRGNDTPTLGGTIAAAVAGSRCLLAGYPRDHVLGFSAVTGKGEIFKAGGRVVKNVTGYDLPKLAAGSMGTLFVMTEITLRSLPEPHVTSFLIADGLAPKEGLQTLRKLAATPYEPSALIYIPEANDPSQTVLRFEGVAGSVAARQSEVLRADLANLHVASEAEHRKLTSLAKFLPSNFDPETEIWQISVPPSRAANAVQALEPDAWIADWAGARLWLAFKGPQDATRLHRTVTELAGYAVRFRPHAKAAHDIDIYSPASQGVADLNARLKAVFDPAHILNPGRIDGRV